MRGKINVFNPPFLKGAWGISIYHPALSGTPSRGNTRDVSPKTGGEFIGLMD